MKLPLPGVTSALAGFFASPVLILIGSSSLACCGSLIGTGFVAAISRARSSLGRGSVDHPPMRTASDVAMMIFKRRVTFVTPWRPLQFGLGRLLLLLFHAFGFVAHLLAA